MSTFYITTAIDYINGLPHIGTAYEKITADCIARAKRLLGYDVRFCMGTDEHSINVKKKATDEGLEPQAYCDRMVPLFEEIWKNLHISYDDFIRTTDTRHKVAVTELFRRSMAKGDIYTADYKGWYCEGCEAFIQEKDLVDGKCPNHMKVPSWIEETNYFFRLSKYGEPLLKHIRANPDFIRPETRRNEIVRLIESGLDDISVSRSGFDWGIPVPGDSGHVIYVWFDALTNYISSLGFGGNDDAEFRKYWPADVHIVGKDITRFHCVIWPAMLMSCGVEVPKSVFGHGFIYHSGEKMSKSLGNIVSPLDIVGKFGADPLRYFFLREVVNGQDGDFTFERFIDRYNSDLANDLGNLVSRTVAMIHKYCGGTLPLYTRPSGGRLYEYFLELSKKWKKEIEWYNLSGACQSVMDYVKEANKYIEENAPWNLAKDPKRTGELAGILCDLSTVIVNSARLLYPFIPESSNKIWRAFGYTGDIGDSFIKNEYGVSLQVPVDTYIQNIGPIFPRIESDNVIKMSENINKNKKEEKNYVEADILQFPDFMKVDIRVGTVTAAERVEKSDKLLRLFVDDGMGGRKILAGIAQHYMPEELAGKQVLFVANLKPRRMMGEISEGMVLAAVHGEGLNVIVPDGDVPPGTKVS